MRVWRKTASTKGSANGHSMLNIYIPTVANAPITLWLQLVLLLALEIPQCAQSSSGRLLVLRALQDDRRALAVLL